MKLIKLIFKKNKSNKKEELKIKIDPLIEIGKIIKKSRLDNGLSIKSLSDISRIPSATIVALEDNIKEDCPKDPFLKSILLKLEECLKIKDEQFLYLLKKKYTINQIKEKENINFIVNKFDFLNSWLGKFIYILILIISLLIINTYYSTIPKIEFNIIEGSIKD